MTWQVVQAQLISQACSIVDAVLEQAVADRLARLGARSRRPRGSISACGSTLMLGISTVLDASTRLPASARRMPRSMRRAANASVRVVRAPRPPLRSRARSLAVAQALRSVGEQRVDRRALAGVEQVAVGRERRLRSPASMRSASTRASAQRARAACRLRRVLKRLLQHARDLVVGQAVRRLDDDRRLDARASARARDTDSRPSASTWKVTRMRAAPATIGGMPRSSKRASERQSATSSRSPCTTCIAIAVWPSLKVVNSCARATGIVELRGMIFSTRPPIVSMPSDSGITSSSSQSSPCGRLPASRLAWIAAPSATTSSGSRLVSGVAAEELADRAPHLRHARRAADHHHALDVVGRRAARRAAPCAPAPSVLRDQRAA